MQPRAIVVVGGGASLLGLVHRSWPEGALDVVLHESAVPECVLDGELMVWARRIQEPLEVVPGRGGLGRIALWERRLALHRHDKVVVTVALVILLLLLEA
jgi:hypothetical protein